MFKLFCLFCKTTSFHTAWMNSTDTRNIVNKAVPASHRLVNVADLYFSVNLFVIVLKRPDID